LSEQPAIKIRIDVDYPYPSSRTRSFLYVALGIKRKGGLSYLRNARDIAEMINKSPKKVRAYWFFTPYTIPDQKLLNLLNPERHEVSLHIATNAEKEWKRLEKETGRNIKYYTFHGTSSPFAQILWRRKLGQGQAEVPNDFPLKNFHNFKTTSLDRRVFEAKDTVNEEVQKWIKEGTVIAIHPEWLYVSGEKNRRGPVCEILKLLLGVD
jgi:hypothetical protein